MRLLEGKESTKVLWTARCTALLGPQSCCKSRMAVSWQCGDCDTSRSHPQCKVGAATGCKLESSLLHLHCQAAVYK